MSKHIFLWSGILSFAFYSQSFAQLPANPWGTTDDNTMVETNQTSGVAHIEADSKTAPVSIKYKAINADSTAPVYKPAVAASSSPSARATNGDSWRGSGKFGNLNYTGSVTTYGTAYGQEMLAPEVNSHNMKVMIQHLRDLGYKIPESYDNKFQNMLSDYAVDLRSAYDGLGHQNNPFDTMFSGILDFVEEESELDMENLLFNSIDLISQN